MSVYTQVSPKQLVKFLKGFPLGELCGYQEIGEGVENTNYFVSTTSGEYVLTLFERLKEEELGFFLGLMEWLSQRGLPVARPMHSSDGSLIQELMGKPAALIERRPGKMITNVSLPQCKAVGRNLARLHVAAADYPDRRHFDRGEDWWIQASERILPLLPAEHQQLLETELAYQLEPLDEPVPEGLIHADLFRDNVLFQQDEPSGLLDFYFACNYLFVYDLAVTINDWCLQGVGALDQEKALALASAYSATRSLTQSELKYLPRMLRRSALRFWLSRLDDGLFPREGALVKVKDPEEFRLLLCHHIKRSPLVRWQDVLG